MKIFFKSIFCFLLCVCSFQVFSQDKKIEELLLEGYYSEDSSSYYFKEAYSLLKTREDTGSYFYYRFFKYHVLNETDSSKYYAKLALAIFNETNNFDKLRRIHEQIYYEYLNIGDYDLALKEIHQALNYAIKLKDTAYISLHYSDISVLYHDYNFFEKGISYGQKAFNVMDKATNKDYKYLIFANNAIGINYDDWGKPDSALFYHHKNLKYLDKVEDSLRYVFVLNNIANTNLKIKNYKKAKEFLERSLAINLITKKPYNLASTYTNLATVAFEEGRNADAKGYFIKAHKFANESESVEKIRDVLEFEYLFYKKIGDFKTAVEKKEAFHLIQDSIFNSNRLEKIAQMEVKFETVKKEKEIAEQKIKISEQQLKAKQRNNLLFALIAFVVFILIIGWLIYKQQQQKHIRLIEENRLKDQIAQVKIQNKLHEERLRISRDLHDNIGSQLTFIISSVDNMKHLFKSADEKLNKKLADVSGFTRTTITQLRDTIWALNKDEISFDDLKARLYNYIENAQLAQEQTKFKFNSTLSSSFQLNSIQGVSIYRVVQEAINNAMKYSAATTVSLSISENNTNVFISIKDDGIGFNMTKIQLGNGLENMKNRAHSIGAIFDILSAVDKGTELVLTLPKTNLN